MKKIYLFAIGLLLSIASYGNSPTGVRYTIKVDKQDAKVITTVNLNIEDLRLCKQEMLVITPGMISNSDNNYVLADPIVITGNKRYKFVKRAKRFNDKNIVSPLEVIRYSDHETYYSIVFDLPYEPWMRNASFSIDELLSGCGRCDDEQYRTMIGPRILPKAFVPQYSIAYVEPPAEIVEIEDTFVARFNYQLDKYLLLRNYKDNASEFAKVDAVMNELVNDSSLEIMECRVVGYASPEGNPYSNQILSENRAKSFLSYLRANFISSMDVRVLAEGRGEDWDGLYREVEKLHIADRDKVLAIIRDYPDLGQRKDMLHRLSGGTTYRMLLNEVYPPLRRTEYTLRYRVKPFSLEEARERIKVKPRLLSLNEMYLVANSYPKGSDEFKNVFDIASRIYPEDEYAIMNSAALAIESEQYRTAIDLLLKLSSPKPEALNNLGVAYFYEMDLEKAKEYLKQAAKAGYEDAEYNLDQLEKYILD